MIFEFNCLFKVIENQMRRIRGDVSICKFNEYGQDEFPNILS